MKGMLSSRGYLISETHIARSLHRIAPVAYEHRRNDTHNRLNPEPYMALYPGHKLHLDQNEKLVMFGVVHVIARDGFSGKIVSFASMPVKNNIVIYDEIYR